MLKWLSNLFSNDNIAEEMFKSVQNENNYINMNKEELKLNHYYDKETTPLRTFDINPNKKTILIIDDYIGIMKTPEIIIRTSKDLKLEDYNIIKFYGISAGKELLCWVDNNPNTKVDIGIIDILINGIDGVDIVTKILEHSPDMRFNFYSGIDIDSNEYKANKARAKFLKFLPKYNFLDVLILKSNSYKDVIAPSIYNLIKG